MDCNLKLVATPARRQFKKNTGQNNHFLITLLVGLDAVQQGVAKKHSGFSTVWSPRDHVESARRSRSYALQVALVWVTEALASYRISLTDTPGLFSRVDATALKNAGDGDRDRLAELVKRLKVDQPVAAAMSELAISWRNRVVHGGGGAPPPGLVGRLRSLSTDVKATHNGFDVKTALEDFGSRAPTFKEVASFIRASQDLVQAIDAAAIAQIDLNECIDGLIQREVVSRFDAGERSVCSRFWADSPEKTAQRLVQLLQNAGLTRSDHTPVDAEFWSTLCQLSAAEARERFVPSPAR